MQSLLRFLGWRSSKSTHEHRSNDNPLPTSSQGLLPSHREYLSLSRSGNNIPFTRYNPKLQIFWFLLRRFVYCALILLTLLALFQFGSLIHEAFQNNESQDYKTKKGYQAIHSLTTQPADYFEIDSQETSQKLQFPDLLARQNNTTTCKIAFVTTFPPEKCGIAEYAENLYESMSASFPEWAVNYKTDCTLKIIVLHDHSKSTFFRNYDSEKVDYIIDLDDNLPSKPIFLAAKYINENKFTHVLLQNEYGLTPIMWQQIDLLRWISPTVKLFATIHTPRAHPSNEEREFLFQLGNICEKVFVMSHLAQSSLEKVYLIPADKIRWIPHGIKKEFFGVPVVKSDSLLSPDMSFAANRTIIFSNGLIHRFKGYEKIINVLPHIVQSFPDVLLLVVGQEHFKDSHYGTIMKGYLDQAERLGVARNVKWIDSFVTDGELSNFFAISDIFITLYDEINPVSGTLTTAMAAGRAILSTPFNYAIEMLKDEIVPRGHVLKHFDDQNELQSALLLLLEGKELRKAYGTAAKKFVEQWLWEEVSKRYFLEIIDRDVYPPTYFSTSAVQPSNTSLNFIWHNSCIKLFSGDYLYHQANIDFFTTSFLSDVGPLTNLNTADISLLPKISVDSPVEKFLGEKDTTVACLVADSDIQINAAFTGEFVLKAVGIRCHYGWLYYHSYYQMDAQLLDERYYNDEPNIVVSWQERTILLNSKNFQVRICHELDHVKLNITCTNTKSAAVGLVASELLELNRSQISSKRERHPYPKIWQEWQDWLINDGFLFSTYMKKQQFELYGIHGNIFKMPFHDDLLFSRSDVPLYKKKISATVFRDQFSEKLSDDPVILLQIDGPIFNHTGFAHVNRMIAFHLLKYQLTKRVKVLIKLKVDDLKDVNNPEFAADSILTMLLYQNVRYPYWDISLPDCFCSVSNRSFHDFNSCNTDPRRVSMDAPADIMFRNSWPFNGPNFDPPLNHRTKWIQQQPWEFFAIPKYWQHNFKDLIDELWVPSTYCAESFTLNGIPRSKIFTVSHGVDYQKIRAQTKHLAQQNLPDKFSAERILKIYAAGGALLRKGMDVALNAYVSEFSRTNHTKLTMSMAYGIDEIVTRFIKFAEIAKNHPTAPDIELIYCSMTDAMINGLFKESDIFLGVYRSEGFGLMILEALASGLPVVVPSYGPAAEFTDSSCAFYVEPRRLANFTSTFPFDGALEECHDYPCGEKRIFEWETTQQPRWSVPSEESLRNVLKEIYENPQLISQKRQNAFKRAEKYQWADIVERKIYPRLFNLTLNDDPIPKRTRYEQERHPSIWQKFLALF